MDLYELFGEDEDLEEILNLIRFDDFEDATNVKDELSYNEGWYNYSTLKFDYKGKRYSIEYKEHTSDNISEMEFLYNTFACLGDATEMNETISKEDLAIIKLGYERRIANLEKELKKKNELLNILKPLSNKQLETVGKIFLDINSEEESNLGKIRTAEEAIGTFFIEMSRRK